MEYIPEKTPEQNNEYDQSVVLIDTGLIQRALSGVQKSKEEFRTLLAQAEMGDPSAQYDVGIRYVQGDGVEKDPAKAADWLRRAAEEDDLRAVDEIGRAHV